MKQLQRVIKSEKIDEGGQGFNKLSKYRVFERKFDQYFSKDNMSQVLQEALMMEPDISTNYYARTDQLLLVLYNKVNGKRSSENLDKVHSVKNWRAEYRVMPNFQNWMKQYSKSIHPVAEFQPRDNFDAQVKLVMDPTSIPSSMYDIDFNCVQNLQHTVQQYLPDDNSIMNSETYEVAGKQYQRSVVYKDKFSFGFSDKQPNNYMPLPE